MSFIFNEKALKYFKKLNADAPSSKNATLMGFLGLDDPTIKEILRPMLHVNPYFRPTAKELLRNKYFDDVRIPVYERSSLVKLTLQIDNEELKDPATL